MLFKNPKALRGPYPPALKDVLCIAQAQATRAWLSRWDMLNAAPTPTVGLPGLARQFGVGRIVVKDESQRSPLGSFKALGAPAALVRLVLRAHPTWEAEEILRGTYRAQLADWVVISATDGNHGRALAAAARSAGVRCVIVLHKHVSEERESAIAALGAQIERVAGNYDASVAHAAQRAAAHGWQVVSDTSYAGYEEIPRDVMQGYGVIADELAEQCPGTAPFTHVILQGGVGGLAAGIVSYLWEQQASARPVFIVVEPKQADCLLQSAIQGRAAKATGSVDSVMAGLACGETSPLAWRFLGPSVDFFMTIEDVAAVAAMKALARPQHGDMPLVSGESGAAALAALERLCTQPGLRAQAGIDPTSRVLLINTEGATAPALFKDLAGCAPADVLAAQAAWRQGPAAR